MYSFFYLVFGSFVAGIKTLLAFRNSLRTAFIRNDCVVCSFLSLSQTFFRSSSSLMKVPFFANIRNSQSVSALTDNKFCQSNALQTKYINKFRFVFSSRFLYGLMLFGNDLETTSKYNTSDSSFVLIRSNYARVFAL